MSFASKVVLGSSCVFALGIISYVHFKQILDREQLHQGVLKDVERRQRRKVENLYVLEKQQDLRKQLQKEQDNAG